MTESHRRVALTAGAVGALVAYAALVILLVAVGAELLAWFLGALLACFGTAVADLCWQHDRLRGRLKALKTSEVQPVVAVPIVESQGAPKREDQRDLRAA